MGGCIGGGGGVVGLELDGFWWFQEVMRGFGLGVL